MTRGTPWDLSQVDAASWLRRLFKKPPTLPPKRLDRSRHEAPRLPFGFFRLRRVGIARIGQSFFTLVSIFRYCYRAACGLVALLNAEIWKERIVSVNVSYRNTKMRKIFDSKTELIRKYGSRRGLIISNRVAYFEIGSQSRNCPDRTTAPVPSVVGRPRRAFRDRYRSPISFGVRGRSRPDPSG